VANPERGLEEAVWMDAVDLERKVSAGEIEAWKKEIA
jgi:hypothetical protein